MKIIKSTKIKKDTIRISLGKKIGKMKGKRIGKGRKRYPVGSAFEETYEMR